MTFDELKDAIRAKLRSGIKMRTIEIQAGLPLNYLSSYLSNRTKESELQSSRLLAWLNDMAKEPPTTPLWVPLVEAYCAAANCTPQDLIESHKTLTK